MLNEVSRVYDSIKEEELLAIVAELAEQYTGHESTSVSEDTAKMLMEAVCYCIREAQEEGIAFQSAAEGYKLGYALVCEKRKKAEQVYKLIIHGFQAYENRAYYDTIAKGMPAFFLRYHPKFKPQDHILTLDYPLLSEDCSLSGVDRIYDYLLKIRLEQRFLNKFPVSYVRTCLEEYHSGYEELYINICQVVLHAVLKKMLEGMKFTGEEQLKNLLKILITKQYGGNEALLEYLSLDMKELAIEIKEHF